MEVTCFLRKDLQKHGMPPLLLAACLPARALCCVLNRGASLLSTISPMNILSISCLQ